jgi:hypothetical protein
LPSPSSSSSLKFYPFLLRRAQATNCFSKNSCCMRTCTVFKSSRWMANQNAKVRSNSYYFTDSARLIFKISSRTLGPFLTKQNFKYSAFKSVTLSLHIRIYIKGKFTYFQL